MSYLHHLGWSQRHRSCQGWRHEIPIKKRLAMGRRISTPPPLCRLKSTPPLSLRPATGRHINRTPPPPPAPPWPKTTLPHWPGPATRWRISRSLPPPRPQTRQNQRLQNFEPSPAILFTTSFILPLTKSPDGEAPCMKPKSRRMTPMRRKRKTWPNKTIPTLIYTRGRGRPLSLPPPAMRPPEWGVEGGDFYYSKEGLKMMDGWPSSYCYKT